MFIKGLGRLAESSIAKFKKEMKMFHIFKNEKLLIFNYHLPAVKI